MNIANHERTIDHMIEKARTWWARHWSADGLWMSILIWVVRHLFCHSYAIKGVMVVYQDGTVAVMGRPVDFENGETFEVNVEEI